MSMTLLTIALIVLALMAWWFRQAYYRALHDQIMLANFLMEVLTSDRERSQQKANFLDFVLKSKYPNAGMLSAMCSDLVIGIAKRRAYHTIPANRDLYWQMNKTPQVFFEGGDPSKPR